MKDVLNVNQLRDMLIMTEGKECRKYKYCLFQLFFRKIQSSKIRAHDMSDKIANGDRIQICMFLISKLRNRILTYNARRCNCKKLTIRKNKITNNKIKTWKFEFIKRRQYRQYISFGQYCAYEQITYHAYLYFILFFSLVFLSKLI